jgi:hypothetical protein
MDCNDGRNRSSDACMVGSRGFLRAVLVHPDLPADRELPVLILRRRERVYGSAGVRRLVVPGWRIMNPDGLLALP